MTYQQENRTSLGTFFRGATFYGMSVAVAKLGNFLILPFFWHALSPADFGLVGIIQLVQALLVPVFSLGLFDGVLRFYVDWNEEERRNHAGSVMTLVACWVLLVSAGSTMATPSSSSHSADAGEAVARIRASGANIFMRAICTGRANRAMVQKMPD